jgi:hypothetical protein
LHVLPGGSESAIEGFRAERRQIVAGSDFGINVADGRPRLDERAADIEGDGAN